MTLTQETYKDLTSRRYSHEEACEVIKLAIGLCEEKLRGLNCAGELVATRTQWLGSVAEAKDLFICGQR